MFSPLLTARQSSWLYTVALLMMMFEDEPTPKASVLWPPFVSPRLLSMVTESIVRPRELLMLKQCTGAFLMKRSLMVESYILRAKKNLGWGESVSSCAGERMLAYYIP